MDIIIKSSIPKLREKLLEALQAVLPIAAIVLVLCFSIAPVSPSILLCFLLGAAMIIVGIMFFTLGAEMSMTPMGERVGSMLTRSQNLFLIIGVGFLLGFLITISEPDLQVLANQVPSIPNMTLILSVAAGVGIFLVMAFLRMLLGIPLPRLLVIFYAAIFLLAAFVPKEFLAVAFDSGGVTTGPMTVPFIMALGVGVSAIRSDRHAADDSFGLVALCSIGPILAVLILGIAFQASDSTYVPPILPNVSDSVELWQLFHEGLPTYIKEIATSLLPIIAMFGVFQLAVLKLDRRTLGRIGVGRVERGSVKVNAPYVLCRRDDTRENIRVTKLYQFEGLKRVPVEEAVMGDLICVAGIADLNIGETLCAPECVEPLPFVKIDEPTISMNFMVNDSPFAGREGKYVTSRNLRDRLFKEVETNVSMRVEETDSMDTFKVSGRGELHLSILIETMRRENYEFAVSRPQVILKKDPQTGKTLEPMELAIIEVPEAYVGAVMEKLCSRKGEIENMDTRSTGMTHLEIKIPARGLIGYRSEFLTDTNGNGIMNQLFGGYEPYKGEIATRTHGSIVVHETGTTSGYGLWNTQDRGRLFVGPGVEVYEGMIVGECAKDEDIVCNVCKKKHVTNTRASGSDEALKLVPPTTLSLEQSMEFLADDELLEVTPKSIRLRKMILDKSLRLKAESRRK